MPDYKIENKKDSPVYIHIPDNQVDIEEIKYRLERLEYSELVHSKALVSILKRLIIINVATSIGFFFAFLEIGHVAGWI